MMWESLRTSLWAMPFGAIILGGILALVLVDAGGYMSVQGDAWYLFGGQPDSARDVLSTIANSLIALTGVVFSITILVLQLAGTQFSSRVLRTFFEDRHTQFTLSMFVGSVTYAMVTLPQVRNEMSEHPAFVPALAVFGAIVLLVACLMAFVHYIHHMAHSIRAVNIVSRVGDETRREIERICPPIHEPRNVPEDPVGPPSQELAHDRPAGVLVGVDHDHLLSIACKHDVLVGLVPAIGDFLPRGAPLFRVWGASRLNLDELRGTVSISAERTPHQDPAFGFRQLVDIGERALSPGINDPTTAVQALDQLHDLLRALATRGFPARWRADESGTPRLLQPQPDWETYVRLALDELRQYGGSSIQVMRRMRGVVLDLQAICPPERCGVLEEQLRLLDAAIEESFTSARDRQHAREPSRK